MCRPDAFDIASQFLDSGAKRNDLEVAILRHMEHRMKRAMEAEREACAKLCDAARNDDRHGLEACSLAAHLADMIRRRSEGA